MSKRAKQWVLCLCFMSIIWLVYAGIAARITSTGIPSLSLCLVSGGYLLTLLILMMVANCTRVRMFLMMVVLYACGVAVRSAYGVLDATLIVSAPKEQFWFAMLEGMVRPFAGFSYLAQQLTGHFVTELYWMGLICVSVILFCLACAGFMAVTSRNRAEQNRKKERASYQKRYAQALQRQKEQTERNAALLEQTIEDVYSDSK